ncbi:hypothetical protein ABZ281_41590, partial [Streptomyces sp. NPDC006265]
MTTLARPAGHDPRGALRDTLVSRVDIARKVAAVTSLDRQALDAWVAEALSATVEHACRMIRLSVRACGQPAQPSPAT